MATQSRPKKRSRSSSPAAKQEAAPATVGPHCTIVGFGASAGGLEAFSEVLAHLPADTGLALVFVQHLDPKHASVLAELLARGTSMPVVEARDGMNVEPNHVYVIPPNANLTISQGFLRISKRVPSAPHMPVDVFFRSLAEQEGSRAIGVILSGTASDGTLGLRAIKVEGGITFCQDPASGKYDGMPRSAIAAGCVDFVLPPAAIARELVRLCSHAFIAGPQTDTEQAVSPDLSEILTMLRAATGVDFTFYKHATIRRRILRRMALKRIDTPGAYVKFLRENRSELEALFRDILINVTSFFREPDLFDFLKTDVFPELFRDRAPDDAVRVWVAGCSTGEEAYSMAILLLEYISEKGIRCPIQIFGTDLSEAALEKARAGMYAENIATDISAERLREFFTRQDGSYQIARSVRDVCIFARQNILKDPPFSKLDLITCRNVLIYLGALPQQKIMRVFHYALKPGGFLILGNSETIGSASELFQPRDRKYRVYSRKSGVAPMIMDVASHTESQPDPEHRATQAHALTYDLQRRVDQLLLSLYSPPGVVVDAALNVLQFRGRTTPYLEHAAGEANLNLLKMTRGGLGLEIRKLVQRAAPKEATVRSETLQLTENDSLRQLRLAVTPVQTPGMTEKQFLVLFEDVPPSPPAETGRGKTEKTVSTTAARHLKELEQELSATKLYLQSVIQEQEATTEELKSANEEIQSSNEELQSTNEELLTAKEELQSTNEELTTVNEEMQSRNTELTQINDDLNNLLSSVSIPIVMVGNDLRIRRFTPQAEKILNLLSTDIGRPIGDLKPKIDVPELARLFLDVIDNLTIKEREVQDREGRQYAMWVRPYRTSENKIDGAVMTLYDVTERKNLADARYRRLFEAGRHAVLIVEAATREILDANPFALTLTGRQRAELVHRHLSDTGILSSADLQDLISALAKNDVWYRRLNLTNRAGAVLDVEIVANVYRESEKQVWQLNIRDLTGRRREARAGQAQAEGRDSENLRLVGRLAGSVAREFSDFVTTILGFSHVLEERLGSGHEAASYLAEIRRAGERAAEVTRQLLAFGRSQTPHAEVLDLNDILSGMEQMIRILMPATIQVQIRPAGEPVKLKTDRFQAEQIVLDLAVNARDSMPRGGTLTLESSNVTVDEEFTKQHPAVPPGQYAVLRVVDTGNPVDGERRLQLPLNLTRGNPGSAAWLETLQATLGRAKGHLWSYSEMGKGSTFSVYFPTVAADEPDAAAQSAAGTESILVVDDEPPVRRMVASVLRELGYTVFEASNGPEALRAAQEDGHSIQLLLTDVIMAGMSGRELADRLRETYKGLKVLYVSGDLDETIADFGVLQDGIALLRKPFTPAVLAAEIRHVLDRSQDSTG